MKKIDNSKSIPVAAYGILAIASLVAATIFILALLLYKRHRSKSRSCQEAVPIQVKDAKFNIIKRNPQPAALDYSTFGSCDLGYDCEPGEQSAWMFYQASHDQLNNNSEPVLSRHNSSSLSVSAAEHSTRRSNPSFVVGSDDETESGAEMWRKAGGKLKMSINYDSMLRKLQITIQEAYDLPMLDKKNGSSQCRLALLPSKRQRFKTKVVQGPNPKYRESFTFSSINSEDIENSSLRLRLYCHRTMMEVCLAGEAEVKLSELLLCRDDLSLHLTLYPGNPEPMPSTSSESSGRAHSRDSSAGTISATSSPRRPLTTKETPKTLQILLGLMYSRATGKLVVSVLKAQGLKALEPRPDSFVQLTMLSAYGDDIGTRKTTIRKGSGNPYYDESFIFQVLESELQYITLVITIFGMTGSVWRRRMVIGWLPLGESQGCDAIARSHWLDMKESNEATIARWHQLREDESDNPLQP